MARTINLIWVCGEAESFCKAGWTGFRARGFFCPTGKSLARFPLGRFRCFAHHTPKRVLIKSGTPFDVRHAHDSGAKAGKRLVEAALPHCDCRQDCSGTDGLRHVHQGLVAEITKRSARANLQLR
jgi:hypothetical protein